MAAILRLDVAAIAAEGRRAVRARGPLVHYMTNQVAMTPAANALLAVGAAPAMILAAEEVVEFGAVADALALNIGTLDAGSAAAMGLAADAARERGKPWALDPVGVGASRFRTRTARGLFAQNPTLLRANASETLRLAGEDGALRGVDAGDPVDAAAGAARSLARDSGGVVGVTGAVDLVTDGRRTARVAGGHALMPRLTALGCCLTGVSAAYLAAMDDPFDAVVAAFALFGAAGAAAGKAGATGGATGAGPAGPASFQIAFFDALYALSPDDLAARAEGWIEAAPTSAVRP